MTQSFQNPAASPASDLNSPFVVGWLWLVAGMIFLMVLVGGATRLTDSGLSITEWKPLLGAIPPLNDMDWQDAFAKYKQIPEYQIQNKGMSLDEFKFIYWWEWGHRFLGRIIGFVFVVPLIGFVVTGHVTRALWPRLLVFFALGGLQGALGWYMVSSGLEDRLDVSQYRLAAHLSLAVVLFAAILWTVLPAARSKTTPTFGMRIIALAVVLFIFLQVAAGGFVAGLDAGHAAYDWPTMQGAWIPDGLGSIQPLWRNLFENALTTQFVHRLLAYALIIVVAVQAYVSPVLPARFLLAAVVAQATLGISTVLLQVPLAIALAHQGGALVVLALALWQLKSLSPSPVQDRQ